MKLVKINEVKPNPSNPRVIKDHKFAQLKKSLEDFPDMANVRPIVVNKDMVVLGGNMRLKAMKDAGWKQVPVEVVDWPEDKQREFIIKDNVGFGEWDWEMIANEWDAEKVTDWGLDIPDFKVEAEAQEDDYEIPDEVQTDIVLGDLFEIGEHRLLCGDSTDSNALDILTKGEKADLVLTDPPYNGQLGGAGFKSSPDVKKRINKMQKSIEKIYDFNPMDVLNISAAYCKTPISMFFFCNKNLVPYYINFALENKKGFDLLLWHKPNFLPMGGQHYFPDTEYIIKMRDKSALFVNGLGKDVNYGTYWVIESLKGAKKEGVEHPTIKPQKILSDCMKITSKEGHLVIDFFLGSGSTMVAAHQLNRKCYGMELDPKYCQVIVDRMRKLDPNIKILKNGQPYDN